MDVQGPELPARYVKQHGVTYPVAVDRGNVIAGSLLGHKVIPVWTLLDEAGRLVASATQGPQKRAFRTIDQLLEKPPVTDAHATAVRRPSTKDLEAALAKDGDLATGLELATLHADAGATKKALAALEKTAAANPDTTAVPMLRADVLLRAGKKKEALASLRAALAMDPKDYLVRKQIWCIEQPDRFYEGRVDYGWQNERLKKEKAAESGSGR